MAKAMRRMLKEFLSSRLESIKPKAKFDVMPTITRIDWSTPSTQNRTLLSSFCVSSVMMGQSSGSIVGLNVLLMISSEAVERTGLLVVSIALAIMMRSWTRTKA